MHDYSAAELTRLFHLSKTLLALLVKHGYVAAPARRGKTQFTFQELLVLRAASALQGAGISAAKIIKALGNVRATLPPEAVITALAVSPSGKDMAIRDGGALWEATSGQFALPLQADVPASVSTLPQTRLAPSTGASSHYARGHALEETDVEAARAAYLEALRIQADHLEARINLGRLLHLAGDLKEAERVYRACQSRSAVLSFNLATLMEDMRREGEAVAAYRDALAQDPHLHDAHFNLSRLYERSRQPREALRHLLAYRRHLQQFGE